MVRLGRGRRTAAQLARRQAEAQSMIHRDSASFDADLRPGACLVDEQGIVIVSRCVAPMMRQSAGERSISPRPLPAEHPRARETVESSRALWLAEHDPWE
jgi:hypothetical protein